MQNIIVAFGIKMNHIFDYMMKSLDHWNKKIPNKKVSKKDYERFCKDYIFMKLKGITFGQAFCERFEIHHFIVASLPGDSAKGYIEKHGFVQK